MLRPRVFFDTSFCIDLARGRIPTVQWAKSRKRLTKQFRYCISPLTLYELLVGFGRSKDQFFEQNKEAIRILYGSSGNRTFLRLPGQFVMETVLGIAERKVGFETEDYDLWIKAVLRASDKQSLETGRIEVSPRKLRTFGLNLRLIENQVQEGKDAHADELEELRKGNLLVPSSAMWASGIMRRMQVQPTTETCERLATVLDAAYRFDYALWELALESKYDFAKHASDWIDVQQLYYLCDSEMSMVTADNNYRARTANGNQSARILLYSELLRALGS